MNVFETRHPNSTQIPRLANDERFAELARQIGDGWTDLEAQAARLDEFAELPTASAAIDDNRLAALVADPNFDLIAALDERDATLRAAQRRDSITNVVRLGRMALSERGLQWVRNHQAELCALVLDARKKLRASLLELEPILAPLGTADDIGSHPHPEEAAIAMADSRVLVAEWNTWTATHRAIVDAAPVTADTLLSRWPGIDWVRRLDEQWPEFFAMRAFSVDVGYMTPGSLGLRPPWTAETVLEQARAIASFEPWAPTHDQLRAEFVRLNERESIEHMRTQQEMREQRDKEAAGRR